MAQDSFKKTSYSNMAQDSFKKTKKKKKMAQDLFKYLPSDSNMAQDSFKKTKKKKKMEQDLFKYLPSDSNMAQDSFKKTKKKKKMAQNLFKYLPSEIMNDILLRLPVRAIAASKCVCRSWLDLLESDEFVKSHHARSSESCLAVLSPVCCTSYPYTKCSVWQINTKSSSVHLDRYSRLTSFTFPYEECVGIEGSANGLFFLYNYSHNIVCNPISREYIHLRCPVNHNNPEDVIYGFGVSKISGQYKVVRYNCPDECHVYTLGTGSWRLVEAPHNWLSFESIISGACVNGNLHWLASEEEEDEEDITLSTCCFDLETECFSTFNLPAPLNKMPGLGYVDGFSVLRDCLCVCYREYKDKMAMWLMKEYGDEKSWTREYVIDIKPNVGDSYLYPIKVFKDGDMLMICSDRHTLLHYSKKKKDVKIVGCSTENGHTDLNRFILLTPSIRSLKSFGMENVISF